MIDQSTTDQVPAAAAPGSGWFDAHVLVGRNPELPQTERDRLADHLVRYDLRGALVGSLGSWLHDPLLGNADASCCADRLAGVRACWTAVPPTPGELSSLTGLVQQAVNAGVAAFRLYPRTHGYAVTDPVWTPFFDALTRHRLTWCVDRTEIEWPVIEQIGARHPELTMIISLVGYRELRTVATMLDRHPRLHLDLVNFAGHQALEWLVAEFGADRILFGTGLGRRDPGESVARLAWSGLPDSAVRLIGSGNAARVFGGCHDQP